jgi:hypothetical protein
MKITIEYESSWRNSFLDGSNNEPIPKKGRKFIASMTELKRDGNFIQRNITKDTVMGILNRLIGEQRKLYQVRISANYYLADIEKSLENKDIINKPLITNEVVYIRNMSGNEDKNSFTGLIKAKDPAFQSDFSDKLWGILWLDLDQILDFILNPSLKILCPVQLDPIIVCEKIENLNSKKPLNVVDKVKYSVDVLKTRFPVDFLNIKDQIQLVSLYTASLYIQIDILKRNYDLSNTLTKNDCLSGISKKGFTKKNFMARYSTGDKKLIWGNPYILKEKKKGQGETVSLLTKADGVLEINLDIPETRAKDLEQKILDAGVSSFYLGKKGLAYVTKIDTRENI